MRTKSFLIGACVLIVGIIIYKFLFGLVLPIVLFVCLGSILKILIKGTEENIDEPASEFITENSVSLSKNDVVVVEPMNETNKDTTTQFSSYQNIVTDNDSDILQKDSNLNNGKANNQVNSDINNFSTTREKDNDNDNDKKNYSPDEENKSN